MDHIWTAYIQEAKDFSYKRYMADISNAIIVALTNGKCEPPRWMDKYKKEEPEEDGDTIAIDIIKRAGLNFGGKQNESV